MRSTALRWPATERSRARTSFRDSVRTPSSYPLGEGVGVGQSAHGSAAARRANAAEGPRRARRPAAPDRAGPRPPEGYRRGAAAVDDPLGSAGHGEDDPRGDRREARERAVRRDLGGSVRLAEDAENGLVAVSNGDARVALNALELAADAATPGPDGKRPVGLEEIREALQRRSLLYDRAGDQHYDTISAFIKSVRGSDPDAALYWLMRMIDAGEDPMFIARRIVILAGEDVGLADPQARVIASAAQQATHLIGLPEGYYPLAEATVYCALAPKSDSLKRGLGELSHDLAETRADPVPLHLRNAPTPLMANLGYGQGYKYAHDYEGHVAPNETYLPESLQGRRYYVPTELGVEAKLKMRLQDLRPRSAPGRDTS